MTVLGYDSTVPVSMDEMVMLASAVTRGAHTPLVIGDLPFGSYQSSNEQAVQSAIRYLKEARCDAVKLEMAGVSGAVADKRESVARAKAIVSAGIPVMGHVGLTPQSYRKFGGYKVQGKNDDAAKDVLDDAAALAQAGCFAIVLEAVPRTLAAQITREIPVPTIGIGAGPDCDGQVLVFHDFVGLTRDLSPKFVRRYAELAPIIRDAAKAYAKDVREGGFPSDAESYPAETVPALRRVY
jgi:3-methyl-2-oxobutanoate hydroxymethyltransferase